MDTSILLVEDLEIVRQGLRALLSAREGFTIIGEAADGLEAVRMTAEKKPDVVLMDLHLPHMDGPDAIRQIKKSYPNTKIIALTADTKDRMLFKSLNAGVDGYVLKKANCEDLVKAIESVLLGKTYISPDLSGHLVEQYRREGAISQKSTLDTLSTREQQVLKLIAGGMGNKAIAETLCISHKTVEKHKANLKKKIAVSTTASLVSFAMDHGLLEEL
ncbi:response regulator transcription factor [Desulfovibrio subterraneus]|uniref:DNA-binding response regulator n=1 Tax=Desulfovibrio subterraneus TaxID=2718620 RepID=A0A7J0BFH3_9BACT|nr:response regulator transcription factor [Desulfovibrio subterraneus]WBF68725.1 response regulator transcription factor [Desulfovibrio subterraneus]GFM31914.1 DNA-binding response regulator [Desulfovibrio subterraneus]